MASRKPKAETATQPEPEAEDKHRREVSEIEVKSLTGDVRDAILTRFRDINKPWKGLSEVDQRQINYAMDKLAEDLVHRVINLLMAEKFPTISVEVGAVKIDKGVEIKLQTPTSVENITALAEHGKGQAVLVLVDPYTYFEERAPAPVEKDQKELLPETEDA